MDPKDYTGKEWTDLMREMTPRQLKNAMKGGYRRVAKKVREVGLRNLASSGLDVQGNRRDWKAGLRSWIYSKGGGFLLTVQPKRGGKETGYHANRRYGKTITRGPRSGNINQRKLPVLMFAEDGTRERNVGDRIGKSSFFSKSRWSGNKVRNYKRSGHSTGKMKAYGFLEKTEPEGIRIVERDLAKDLEEAVMKAAKKAGLV